MVKIKYYFIIIEADEVVQSFDLMMKYMVARTRLEQNRRKSPAKLLRKVAFSKKDRYRPSLTLVRV